jgi:hypothetical protein
LINFLPPVLQSETPRLATSLRKTILSCSGVYGCFQYLSVHALMVKAHFTLSCTAATYFCLHTGGIHLS